MIQSPCRQDHTDIRSATERKIEMKIEAEHVLKSLEDFIGSCRDTCHRLSEETQTDELAEYYNGKVDAYDLISVWVAGYRDGLKGLEDI